MIIKKMTAHFGALDGRTLDLEPGLNVLRAPNESGKSTWCAFLRAMLYGVDTSQRAKQGQHPDKVKYRPWSGAPMSGSMDLETGDGKAVTLRRWTERTAQPMQAFSANLTGTDTPAPGITAENAGQVLTGVGREVFERSAFIRQSGLGFKNAPELEKRLIALVCSGDEEQSYQEADQRLRAWLRRRRSTGKRGAIPETEADIARAEQELDQIAAAAREVDRLGQELSAAEAKQAETVKWMEQARADARRQALEDMRRARQALQEAEEAHRAAETAHEKAEAAVNGTCYGDIGPEEARRISDIDRHDADELAAIAAKLPPVWIAFIPLGLGALAFLLALLLPWKTELFLAGGVGVLLFVVMYLRLLSIRRTKEETLDQRQKILDAYDVDAPEEIDGRLEEYRALWEDMKRAGYALDASQAALDKARETHRQAESLVVNGLDFENGNSEAARATRAVRQGQAALERLRERRAQAEGRAASLGDPMALRSGLEASRSRREELLAQEEALKLALDSLEDADRLLQERFSPLLAAHAAEYFVYLTGGRYDEITLARDLTAKARLTGDAAGWDTDYLSDGTRDQLYLAMRLAVCVLVLPAEQGCPIILDDALITFDQERMERALQLIRTVAEGRQVLLFTCHDREAEALAGDSLVHIIRLGEDEP